MSAESQGERVVPVGGPQAEDTPNLAEKRGGCFRLMLWGTLLIVVGFVGYALGAASGPVQVAEPAQTGQVRQLPKPTATAEIPTVVPPTPIPVCPTDAERQYASDIDTAMVPFVETSGTLGALLTQAGQNTALYVDADWKAQVVLQMAILKLASKELAELKAPTERTREVQVQVGLMAASMIRAVDTIASAIEDLDAEKMRQGTAFVNAAARYKSNAMEALGQLCG